MPGVACVDRRTPLRILGLSVFHRRCLAGRRSGVDAAVRMPAGSLGSMRCSRNGWLLESRLDRLSPTPPAYRGMRFGGGGPAKETTAPAMRAEGPRSGVAKPRRDTE